MWRSIGNSFTIVDSENGNGFVLRRNFPQEEFKKIDKRSLKELGLYPSAALIMN